MSNLEWTQHTEDAPEGLLLHGDVAVVAGLAGWGETVPGSETPALPNTTPDVIKLLREQGLQVEMAVDRNQASEVSLNNADLWVPVVIFAADVAAGGGGSLLADALRHLVPLPRRRSTNLHVRFGTETRKGKVSWFEAHGPAQDVLDAIERHRDSDDG